MLSIKKKETYELAQELSQLTGESLTTAVTTALRERVERLKRGTSKQRAARILELSREFTAQLGDRELPDHATLLYDEETGMPR